VVLTALHWISAPELAVTYGELATVMRPGGLYLNGDHLAVDDTAPTLAGLDRALREQRTRRRFRHQPPEDWVQWWDAVAADPDLGPLKKARDDSASHRGSESGLLSTHVAALRDAGFTEIGTLWQYGDDRLLAAVRG
jgi:hypothetical protein